MLNCPQHLLPKAWKLTSQLSTQLFEPKGFTKAKNEEGFKNLWSVFLSEIIHGRRFGESKLWRQKVHFFRNPDLSVHPRPKPRLEQKFAQSSLKLKFCPIANKLWQFLAKIKSILPKENNLRPTLKNTSNYDWPSALPKLNNLVLILHSERQAQGFFFQQKSVLDF